MANKCDLEEILKDLPDKWRDALIEILLKIQDERESVSCEEVRDCETLTTLSEFTQTDTEICITYTDEDEVSVTRCFDIDTIINDSFEDIDPGCIATQDAWDSMTYTEKIQALIDTVCNCCPATTTTTSSSTTTTTTEETTTTTTTSSSTTTTTTV